MATVKGGGTGTTLAKVVVTDSKSAAITITNGASPSTLSIDFGALGSGKLTVENVRDMLPTLHQFVNRGTISA